MQISFAQFFTQYMQNYNFFKFCSSRFTLANLYTDKVLPNQLSVNTANDSSWTTRDARNNVRKQFAVCNHCTRWTSTNARNCRRSHSTCRI